MDTYFNDKVAVITGAGGVICSKVAESLAELGMTVILAERTMDRLEKTKLLLDAVNGRYDCFECDVTVKEGMDAFAEKVYEKYGRIDYLVNGAGGNNAKATPNIPAFDPRELEENRPEDLRGLYNVDYEVFENVLKLNTMGSFYPSIAFAKYMVRNGEGSIVNFASMNSYCPLTRNFSYAMAKAAVVNMTQSLAAYFGNTGIRVNAVAPGFIVNERSKLVLGTVEEGLTKRGQDVIDHTPMHKFGLPEDMCGCIRWLLDERVSGFVNGVTIPLDGGFLTLSGV